LPRLRDRLDDLAAKEQFIASWRLVGSMAILGDLEQASREIGRSVTTALRRRRRGLGR
jgi:hypothetical protein